VGHWRGYLSGARCRFTYGPADATALTISCSSKSRLVLPSWFYLSGTGSPRSPGQSPGGRKMVVAAAATATAVVEVFIVGCCIKMSRIFAWHYAAE